MVPSGQHNLLIAPADTAPGLAEFAPLGFTFEYNVPGIQWLASKDGTKDTRPLLFSKGARILQTS